MSVAPSLTHAEVAWRLAQQGRYEEARQVVLRHLDHRGEDVDGWNLLAKLCVQLRDLNQALTAALRATTLHPGHADAAYTLGRVHRLSGNDGGAEECYRRSLQAAPDQADVLTSLGTLLRARGQGADAIALYRRALALEPNHTEAANNLGNALRVWGAGSEAVALRERSQSVLQAQFNELCRRAEELQAAGRGAQALTAVSQALRLAPLQADLWLTAGKLASALGHSQTGLEHIEEAARLDPQSYEANEIARRICVAGGLYDRALVYSERVRELAGSADALVARQLLLPSIQQSGESIAQTRALYTQGLTQALTDTEALEGPTSIVGKTPFFVASHPAFYLAYQGENNREVQIDLARMYFRRLPGLDAIAPHCAGGERRPGRLRVGFISRFLSNHSIGKTSRGLIEKLSRQIFEVFVLRITPCAEDETSRAIQAAADRAVDLSPDLAQARAQIAALELDVLFFQDIGMEPTSYLLAFARLAPVQCVSFGHPDTTGIPTMDYFVSNDLFETESASAHYSERLFLLHDLPTLAYYHKPSLTAPANRGRFGFATNEALYLCPQTLFKLHPDIDELLGGILQRHPRAVIALIDGEFKEYAEQLRARFARTLSGVAHRIRFIPRLAQDSFLQLLSVADVILDTPHFNGMNSSLEAFAVGTPVVTWPTEFQRGRHTQAMYRKMNILDAIATDAADYIDIAVRLGTDRTYAQAFRERLRQRNHVLFEDMNVVREFERFFVTAVERNHTPY